MNWNQFLQDYHIDYRTHGKGISRGWLGINCPFHAPKDMDYFMGVHNFTTTCWYCGSHKITDTVSELLGISKPEAFTIIKQYEDSTPLLPSYKTIGVAKTVPEYSKVLSDRELKYIYSRGFIDNSHDFRSGGIVWYNSSQCMVHRIVVPIYHHGRIVSATGRSITNDTIRWKTLSPEFEVIHHKDILFNADNSYIDEAILVEGVFDCLLLGNNTISCFGTNVSEKQLMLLTKYRRLFILFDSDDVGRTKSKKVCDILSVISNTTDIVEISVPEFKDAGSMTDSDRKYLKKDLLGGLL